MKRYFYFLFFLIACNTKDKILYHDSSNKYYVTIEESEKNSEIDSLYTFYDLNHHEDINQVGFFKDGFRNGLWSYNLATGIKTIKWGHYKDKYLNFETNLFSFADSIKHGDFY